MDFFDVLLAKKLSGGGGITPSGEISITQNGTYDVTEFRSAEVSVSGETTPEQGFYPTKWVRQQEANVYADWIQEGVITGLTNIPNGFFAIYNSGTKRGQFKFLEKVTFEKNVTSFGDYAFYACESLDFDSLPSTLTSIGSSAFSECKALSLTSLPSGLTTIGSSAFSGCTNLHLTSLPSGITTLQQYAFNQCSHMPLNSLPRGVTGKIGDYCFKECKLMAISELPVGVTEIGQSTFATCNAMTTLHCPSVTKINNRGISTCTALTRVTLPVVTSVGTYQFQGCTALTTVDLGNPTSFDRHAFDGASALNTLIVRKSDAITTCANINAFSSTPFASGKSGGTLYVPRALISAYQSASVWSTILGYPNNSIQAIEDSIYRSANWYQTN